MIPTARRIVLAIAGAVALFAAARARADHQERGWVQPEYAPPAEYGRPARPTEPALRSNVLLPAPPVWLEVRPPPAPGGVFWTRRQLQREYRWLEGVRARFYRHFAWNPWRVSRFEAWYRARRAALDRRWVALASAPVGGGWHREGWGWHRGHGDRDD